MRVYWLFAGNQFERLHGAVPGAPAGLGQPVPDGQVLPDDPAREGAALPRAQPAAAAELHAAVRRGRAAGAHRVRDVRPGRPERLDLHAVQLGGPACSAASRTCASSTTSLTWCFLIFIPIHIYLRSARTSSSGRRHDLLDHHRRPVRPRPTRTMSMTDGPRWYRRHRRSATRSWATTAFGLARWRASRSAGSCRADVELVDGGTWGMKLLPDDRGARRVLFIDAIDTGGAPGDDRRAGARRASRATSATSSRRTRWTCATCWRWPSCAARCRERPWRSGSSPRRVEMSAELSPTLGPRVDAWWPTVVAAQLAALGRVGAPAGRRVAIAHA